MTFIGRDQLISHEAEDQGGYGEDRPGTPRFATVGRQIPYPIQYRPLYSITGFILG